MANLKALLVIAILGVSCQAVKPPGYIEKPAVLDKSPPRYTFEYEVRDPDGGAQGHTETRRGVYAVGGYYTRLPGETGAQRVSYYADDWGFHPVLVAYGGHGFNTRLAFGDKAVATANAAAESVATGGPRIDAIGVNIPAAVNPLPDLTQTGAAALAAEAPEIPDAANLVSSVGQPPAPPQPPKTSLLVGQTGAASLAFAPQIEKPIQPQLQPIQRVQPLRPLQQPFLARLPVVPSAIAQNRPILPPKPIVSTANYPPLQSISSIGHGGGIIGPASTSILTDSVLYKRPSIAVEPVAPVILSTTPAPLTVVTNAIQHSNGGVGIAQESSSSNGAFVSGSELVKESPSIITPAATVISSGVDALKESSAAAAVAAASALSAASYVSENNANVQHTSFGEGVRGYYSQQANNAANLASSTSTGSFVDSVGNGQLLLGLGKTQYSQNGGYFYQRPLIGGLQYTTHGNLPFGKGDSTGILHITPQNLPAYGIGYQQNVYQQNKYQQNGYQQNGYNQNGYQQNGYNQNGYQQNGYNQNGYQHNGYIQSPGYQGVYPTGSPYVFGGGGGSSTSTSSQSSISAGTSVFKEQETTLSFIPEEVTSRPETSTFIQTQVDNNQFQEAYPSLPPPTSNQFQTTGAGNVEIGGEQTIVSTPSVEIEEFVTARPSRPIVVPELPKVTSTSVSDIETSTPSPPTVSPTLSSTLSSTGSSLLSSSVEVTTPTSITPFYSTFPSNAPCISCQSTRSQAITLLTAPATDAATTLDAELQQVFFPDPTPSLQADKSIENIASTPRPVDVTPTTLFKQEENFEAISTKQPTVSVQVLEKEENEASTFGEFSGSTGTEDIFSAEKGNTEKFFSEEVSGNGQSVTEVSGIGIENRNRFFSGGESESQIFSKSRENLGGQKFFTGSSGASAEGYSGGSGQIYSVTSTPAPPISVSGISLGVAPSPPSILYVDRPVPVPIPYAVPQLVPYAVKSSSASSHKEKNAHRFSSSSSSSSKDSYESSTPSVISVTQITKIRTSGRKNADRGYVKQVVEETGSSSSEDEEEEEVIVRGGSIKVGSGGFGSRGVYFRPSLSPQPFRLSTDTKNIGGAYGERIRIDRPRKLCFEYGGYRSPVVSSDPDYSQFVQLR